MSSSTIGLVIVFIALFADHLQLRKRVDRMSFELRNKVDKPPEENSMEKFKREREERIARLEKENEVKN